MNSERKSFLLHFDSLGILDQLTIEQCGKLFIACRDFNLGKEIELDSTLELVFFTFKNQFKRDKKKYKKIVDRNKSNGSKGGRPVNPSKPKKPTGLIENPSKPKKADSGSVNGSVNVNDNKTIMLNDGFEYFWGNYPRKINKKKAKQLFMNITKKLSFDKSTELVDLISADSSSRYKDTEEKYIPHPTTYLNSELWNE